MPVVPTLVNVKADQSTRLENLQITGTLEVDGATTQTGAFAVTGVLTASGGLKLPVEAAAGDGAITIKSGLVIITKGTAAALTLAAPTAGTDDGKLLYIVSNTAAAHTVTVTGAAGGSGQDVGTFGGAINDGTVLAAYNAKWYIVGAPRNVTWA